jgi:adenine/guanine phosphoribosyltransferase-like PRPP-binding protein
MDFLRSVSRVFLEGGDGLQVTHRLDGRYGPMDPEELVAAVSMLAAAMDVDAVDYVVGFPEGGSIPAFAFARLIGRPLILSTRLTFTLPGVPAIAFVEPHTSIGKTHHLHGLRRGHRVVIVEDEVTTGRTLLSAVRALREAGVEIAQAGALLAVDDPRMWRAMEDEKVSLHVVYRVPCGFGARPDVPPAGAPSSGPR